jgi:hypothetical protein
VPCAKHGCRIEDKYKSKFYFDKDCYYLNQNETENLMLTIMGEVGEHYLKEYTIRNMQKKNETLLQLRTSMLAQVVRVVLTNQNSINNSVRKLN